MRPGFHISIAGGLQNVVPRARELGCESIQLFSRSPRTFRPSVLDEEQAEQLRTDLVRESLHPVLLHAPYVINLGAAKPRLWGASVRMLREETRRAVVLGASYVLVHPGRYQGDDCQGAMWRVVEGLDAALRACPTGVHIAIENTAGQKGDLGSSLEELALMIEAAGRDRLRVVLDVAHLFQAGYAVHEPAGLDETLEKCEELIGLQRVVALHLNDSPTPHGSRVDRHWHLGKGEIGLEGLRGIVRHPSLDHLPAIMETPRQGIEDDRENMKTLRRLLED
jgi:deoxyribonuclease-4